jgi:DNA-directed RNA polymerase subunit RPC12/RpoP
MSSPNIGQNLFQQKLNGMLNDLNSLKLQLSEAENKVYRVDETISKLPARISSVRQMNYQIQTNFEGDQLKAAERWATIGPAIKSEVSSKVATLKSELSSIERDLSARRMSTSYDLSGLAGPEVRINTVRVLVYDFSSRINGEMAQLESILNPLEQGIVTAEEVVKLTSAASFQWKAGETPVVASHAKDMNEKTEGVLTLTNQRIIFESEKEIVLKKTFFIATEKKKERTTVLERPIGSVSKIIRGRVGLLAGAGLFIDFKQGDPQLKLDTKSEEADRIIRFHSLITSGQIDEELSKVKPVAQKNAEKRVISCPKCGAPYTDEIYRGQLTVQCKYCGTAISVQ